MHKLYRSRYEYHNCSPRTQETCAWRMVSPELSCSNRRLRMQVVACAMFVPSQRFTGRAVFKSVGAQACPQYVCTKEPLAVAKKPSAVSQVSQRDSRAVSTGPEWRCRNVSCRDNCKRTVTGPNVNLPTWFNPSAGCPYSNTCSTSSNAEIRWPLLRTGCSSRNDHDDVKHCRQGSLPGSTSPVSRHGFQAVKAAPGPAFLPVTNAETYCSSHSHCSSRSWP